MTLRKISLLALLACATTLSAQSLPKHLLVGYWQNSVNSGTTPQTLAQVPLAYTMVDVAFTNPSPSLDGNVSFDVDPKLAAAVGGYTSAQFINDIKKLHSQHRYVLISVGGAHRSFPLTSDAMVANFVSSLSAIITRFGFDGVDIDLEHAITHDNYLFLEDALRKLHAKFGPGFLITMAPETNDMLPANPLLDNYLQIALDLGDTISLINTQYYNSGTKRGLDGKVYTDGTVDFITALTDAMLQKIDASKLGIGFPAAPSDRGYMEPAAINDVLDCLTAGAHCGSYTPVAKYPNLRAVMFWSTNWDAVFNNKFSQSAAAHLKTLP